MYLKTNYDNMLIGDIYHWERDAQGNVAIMQNVMRDKREAGEI
jgi:hypothetical protein